MAVLWLQVGTDANAELLKSSLSEAGVKLDHLREVDGPSGTAVILVQPSGMQCSRQALAYCFSLDAHFMAGIT